MNVINVTERYGSGRRTGWWGKRWSKVRAEGPNWTVRSDGQVWRKRGRDPREVKGICARLTVALLAGGCTRLRVEVNTRTAPSWSRARSRTFRMSLRRGCWPGQIPLSRTTPNAMARGSPSSDRLGALSGRVSMRLPALCWSLRLSALIASKNAVHPLRHL